MPPIKVIFYEAPDGSVPVLDFLKSLNEKMEAKVAWTISRLEDFGQALKMPYSNH